MTMKTRNHEKSDWDEKIGAFYLWSIKRQDDISAAVIRHMWSAVSAILLMSLLIPIKLETALQIIFYGGLMVCGLLWVIIEKRRSWLLTIKDPVLKETVHQAMVAYIKNKIDIHPSRCRDSENDEAGTTV